MEDFSVKVDNGRAFGESAQNAQKPTAKSIYGQIPLIPVKEAVDGIRYDFNHGLRVLFPQGKGRWRLKMEDAENAIVIFDAMVEAGACVSSVKKYYLPIKFSIWREGQKNTDEPVFSHTLDLRNKPVLIQIPVGTLGDSIAWFSFVERFQQKHKCRVICAMTQTMIDILAPQYPKMKFITPERAKDFAPYATYYMGLFFGDEEGNNQPCDFRLVGLHRTAGMILGLKGEELNDCPPRFNLSAKRKIKKPYAVIACKASSQAKYWNHPEGWEKVIEWLGKIGYRVVCIDKGRTHGVGFLYNHIPWGCEDMTGDRPLQERIDTIKDADVFIGLSSGLSWLAWGCGVPVVMISGFTHPTNEFFTPYRVINYMTCNSCWNDTRITFNHNDFLWCPRQKGTDKQFECSRLITPEQVIAVLKTVPKIRERLTKAEKSI